MFTSSKLQKRGKLRKRWRLFHATDFESLMNPSFTFCQIFGLFPYKIKDSTFEISKPRYILSTVVVCICFIGLLNNLYIFNICGSSCKIYFKGVPRILERNFFYILSTFIVIVTYILNGPRMRLLQTIMKISSKLPSKSYQKLSKLIHMKDILVSICLIVEVPIYFTMDIPFPRKIFLLYINLLIFQMDMLYMNCVCVLKACFKRINDDLEDMRKHMMKNEEVYHLGRIYKQKSSFLLIELKALKKQYIIISNTVQMLNMIFSLQLLATIILTFGEITFELYFHILFWHDGTSMINIDDYLYTIYLTTSITYYFIKITLIVWACETGKDQAVQIGTTVHDVLNSTVNNEIKAELQLFSMQILHHENKFSAKSLTMDATLLTTILF
ncbi:putative gustatory receptor 28b isoform X2 [Monomorium pharaonis]|uniref:putative gustatory receptor 28b isoform X2 n=1 Tax=Monomorium pharaonis TaxID=307658 RepID=UPI001747768F|nr:putative gustatory receptor 28b isoform X2 [Monomorium pharaonis]